MPIPIPSLPISLHQQKKIKIQAIKKKTSSHLISTKEPYLNGKGVWNMFVCVWRRTGTHGIWSRRNTFARNWGQGMGGGGRDERGHGRKTKTETETNVQTGGEVWMCDVIFGVWGNLKGVGMRSNGFPNFVVYEWGLVSMMIDRRIGIVVRCQFFLIKD